MKTRIEIDTRTFVRFWLVVIAFAFAILAIYSARTALILLGVAFFLALALNAPVSLLARHLPGRSRVGGTAIAYVLVIAILGVFAFLVVPPIAQQTMKFISTIPTLINNASTQWHGLSELIARYHLQPQVDSALHTLQANTSGWAAGIGQNLLSGLGSFATLLASSILVIILSFLMLIEGPMWLQRLWGIYNDEDRMEHHRAMVHKMYSVVASYVTGQITVAAIDGAITGLAVFVLSLFFSVPANLALPAVAIAFTLALIPMFGPLIGGALITALLAFNDYRAAIIYVIFFVVYQQIETNFVSPTVQSRRLELSPLTVLSSVVIGVALFGLAGAIISIPIAGCLKVLLEDYLTRAQKNRVKSEMPLVRLAKKLRQKEEA